MIDMSGCYRAAARAALPHALIVADLFYVAQLLNTMVDDVRRRNTHRMRGRRSRAADLEYTIKNLLRFGPRRFCDRGRRRILDTLPALQDIDGEAAHELRVAWTAKNLLLALAPSRTGHATSRTDVARALYRFFDYVTTFGRDIVELVTAAETICQRFSKIDPLGVRTSGASGASGASGGGGGGGGGRVYHRLPQPKLKPKPRIPPMPLPQLKQHAPAGPVWSGRRILRRRMVGRWRGSRWSLKSVRRGSVRIRCRRGMGRPGRARMVAVRWWGSVAVGDYLSACRA